MAARAFMCALFALASGCTLLGLDDFAVRECKSNDTCRAVNEKHGIDVTRASEVYQCAADGVGCVLGPKDWDHDGVLSSDVPAHGNEPRDCDDLDANAAPGKSEVCDGVDNDCDEVVDEDVFAGGKAVLDTPLGSLLASPDQSSASQAIISVDFGSLASSRESGSLDLTFVSAMPTDVRRGDGIALGTIADSLALESDYQISDRLGSGMASCPDLPLADGTPHAVACTPNEVASDGQTEVVRLAASVDRTGCLAGRVRVGELSQKTLHVSSAPADVACAGGYPFVAAAAEGCTAMGELRGVSRLDLARLPLDDGSPAQALVVWTATHALGHDSCGKTGMPVQGSLDQFDRNGRTSVGVAALGIWHNEHTESGVWTTRHEGREEPEVLGYTRGGAPPAVGSVVLSNGRANYLVAFAGDQGPALRAIAAIDGSDSECSPDHVNDRKLNVLRSAEPWSEASDKHAFADYLALAPGTELPAACGTHQLGARIGLAWLEGCGEAQASVWFATVDYTPGTGFCNPGQPVKLGSFAHSVRQSPVALGYAPSGVRRGLQAGGWFASWLDARGQVFVRRVSERDGKVVDGAPRMLSVAPAQALGVRVTSDDQLDLLMVHGDPKDSSLAQVRLSGACSR